MAEVCALCGKKLSLFSQNALNCTGTTEIFCGDCYDRLYDLSPIQRARLVLEKGHPNDRDSLQNALERREADRAEKQKQRQSGLTCLRCGKAMWRRGRRTFKLGEETFFFSDINRLASGSMELELLQCESCGKIEFYDPEFLPQE